MARPLRGEVWRVDLGLAGKVRPAVVVSDFPSDTDYALIAIIPHTTSVRGSTFEVNLPLPFLQAGVFNVQGLTPLAPVRFINRLGVLSEEQMQKLASSIDHWLGLGG